VKALCAKAGRVVKQKDATAGPEPAQATVGELDSTVKESKGGESDEIKLLKARVAARRCTTLHRVAQPSAVSACKSSILCSEDTTVRDASTNPSKSAPMKSRSATPS
jgi:hypothetical protein